ncbi:MAG: energy transducer TonB [Magnetococcales bacterium]|nr:energy transducer TonB [Magnetococcales bacterium]
MTAIFAPVPLVGAGPASRVWQPFCLALLLHVVAIVVLTARTPVLGEPVHTALLVELIALPAPVPAAAQPAAPVSPPSAPPPVPQEVAVAPPPPVPPSTRAAVPPPPSKKIPGPQPVKILRPRIPTPVQAAARPAPAISASPGLPDTAMPPLTPVAIDQPPDRQATYANNPKPDYPPAARRLGYAGSVELTVAVTETGEVARVVIQRSSGFAVLDQAAMAAVSQWRFVPAQHNGQPIATTLTLPVRFQLHTE